VKLLKNFLSLAGAEVFSKLLTFAAFAYLARVLGPGGFGYIEFAGAVLMCASLIVDQGFSPYGAREIAKAPARTGSLAAEIVTVRYGLAAAGYLAIVFFALLIDRGPVMFRLLLVYGLSLWAAPLLLQWIFQGHDRMHLVAVAQVIRQALFAATVFAFVRGQGQILMVAWAEVAGVSGAAAYCVWMYWRNFREEMRLRPAVSAQLFRDGVPIGLSQMFWVVKMFGGTLVLGVISSSQNVGFFAGAQRILIAAHTFVWLYYFNLLPTMSRDWQQNDGEFNRLMESSMHRVVWLSVIAGLGWVAMSHEMMRIVYGPQFAPAGSVLGLLAVVCVMAFISGHYRFGLIAAGHQNAELFTSALGAAFALTLIPIGYFKAGLNGAAMGLVIAEAAIWISSWWCARRMLLLKGNARLLLRPLFALLLASVVLWGLPLQSQILRVVIALLILAALSFALDPRLRDGLRELIAWRRTWNKQIVKARGIQV
jgi:O-antigen/teichoic acid export membrane protein